MPRRHKREPGERICSGRGCMNSSSTSAEGYALPLCRFACGPSNWITLRLRLIKIGALVRQRLDRIRVHLASSHPGEPLWAALASHPTRQ
jgi:hypothetical protein